MQREFIAAALLLATACGGGRAILADHDGGVDDYVALILVCHARGHRVRAVTVAFGNSYAGPAAEATERVLSRYGLRVPVGVHGPEQRGRREFPPAWRRANEAVNTLGALSGKISVRAEPAEAVLGHALDSAGLGGADVLVTGPLTNLAAVLRERRQRIRRIRRLVVMGGAVRTGGNAPGGEAEYNMYVDPEAAADVFSLAGRGLRAEVIPLDATNHFPVTREFIDRLRQGRSAAARQAGEILNLGFSGAPYYLWDGAAALALIRPELFRFEPLRLKVLPDGRTVEDPAGDGPIQVALGIRPGVRPMEEVLAMLGEQ